MFIGRIDAEAETPVLQPPDVKSWLLGKDPDAGKDWRQEEKGTTEDKMVGWYHASADMNLSILQEMVKDRENWHDAAHGVTKIEHDWATEQLFRLRQREQSNFLIISN